MAVPPIRLHDRYDCFGEAPDLLPITLETSISLGAST